MAAEEVQRKQQSVLKGELGRERGITLRCHDSGASQLEGVFARGDRRLGDVLERAFLRGASFDSWEEQLRLDVWEEAFAFYGIDPAQYLGTLPVTARLPWDHFDIGLEPFFLQREYQKALRNRLSPPCGKVAGMFIHHTNVRDAERRRTASGLLRLRRRLRHGEDARGAHLVPRRAWGRSRRRRSSGLRLPIAAARARNEDLARAFAAAAAG